MANNFAMAREIVAWKENVAAHWDDVQLVGDIELSEAMHNALSTGNGLEATLRINTAGLGRDIKVEMVVYKDVDGESRFHEAVPFEAIAEDGDVVTYHMKRDVKYSGVFRYAFRVYPWIDKLPHRQDFAYLKWV